MDTPDRPRSRLDSWKAVASYFGRDERTVRRWEAERGLPIHRLPGGGRSRIFAEVEELEAWRRSGGADADEVSGPASAAAPKASRPWLVAVLIVMNIVSASVVGYLWFERIPGPATSAPSLTAQTLFVQGSQAWEERTPASLNEALNDFNGAVRLDPDYAQAWVGLAKTFDLIREYTPMPGVKAFEQARSAARRALALDDRLAEGHAALAFADYWGYGDADAAAREFNRALALDPNSAVVHHWRATFLASRGDTVGALSEIGRARALDPTSRAAWADHGLLLAQAGRLPEALQMLRAAEAANPDFLSPHAYLEGLYLIHGPDPDFLRECEIRARVSMDPGHQAECAAARRGYQNNGRRGMLQSMLDARLGRARVGAGTAYSVAAIYNLLGNRDQALDWLRQSQARREPDLYGLGGDLYFANLRGDPAFRAILQQVKPI